MHCSDVEELLSFYLDHELLPDENSFVENHLRQCASCRQTLADLQETSGLIRSLPDVPLPDSFQEQFHEMLVRVDRDFYGRGEGRFRQGWLGWLFRSYRLVSAAAILMLCFAVYSFTSLHKNMPSTDQAPSTMNAQLAEDLGDGAGTESKEKARQPAQGIDEKALARNSENRSEAAESKGQLFLFLLLAGGLSFLIVKIAAKFHRK